MRPLSFVTMAMAAIAGMATAAGMDPPAEAALEARDANLGDALHGVLNDDELKKIEGALDVVADKIEHLVSRDVEAAENDDKTKGVLGNALRGFLNDDELKKVDGVFDVVADKIGHLVSRDLEGDKTKGVLGGALDGVLSDDELNKVDGVMDVVADRIGHLVSRDLEAADKGPLEPAYIPSDTPKPSLDYNADGHIDSEDLRSRIKDYLNGKTDRDSFVAWLGEYQQRFKDARKDVSPAFVAMLDILRKIKLEAHLPRLNTTKPSKRSPAEDLVVRPPKLDLDGDGHVDISDFLKEYIAALNGTIDLNTFNNYVHAYKAKVKADRPEAPASLLALLERFREAVKPKPEGAVQELDPTNPSKRSAPVDVIADDQNAAKEPPASIAGLPCDCKNVIASVLEPKGAEGMTREWYTKWTEKYYSKIRWREECFDCCVDESMDRFVTKLKWLRGNDTTPSHTTREEASNGPELEAAGTELAQMAEELQIKEPIDKDETDKMLSYRDWFFKTRKTGEYCTCAMVQKSAFWSWITKMSPKYNVRCARFCNDVVDPWLKKENGTANGTVSAPIHKNPPPHRGTPHFEPSKGDSALSETS